MNIKENLICIVCKKEHTEVPIVQLIYQGKGIGICPQHLPVIIHDPQKLTGIIEGAENFTAG